MPAESTLLLILLVALAAGYLVGNVFPIPRLEEKGKP
jgi:hypothetical protein